MQYLAQINPNILFIYFAGMPVCFLWFYTWFETHFDLVDVWDAIVFITAVVLWPLSIIALGLVYIYFLRRDL